jgi:diguanylate cyclase (GGDEF)-like protein
LTFIRQIVPESTILNMSATPTIRSSQPPHVAKDLATVNGAIERLFEAADVASVVEICEFVLREFGIHGRLRWRDRDDPAAEPAESWLDLAEDPQSARVLSLGSKDKVLPGAARESLARLGRLVDIRLAQLAETSRLYEAISRLALAERLQRALYAIADQASAEHDMPQMMRSLHSIVSSLMYAENFYIVLYDATTEHIRFPFYVDIADPDIPALNQPMPLQDWLHSLTWNLLQTGQPLIGSIDELRLQLGDRFKLFGPSCEHWLGVPMLREGHVVGGIVVQSYRPDTHYSRNDMELLNYVAQHVQTALERREAHLELSRRVTDRTAALREANRVLRQQVLQRQRGERLQAALFRIAELASTSESLDKFYAAVHQVISGLLYARNFYIALQDEDTDQLSFPYSVDEVDRVRPARAHGRGATEYVLRHAKPLLATPEAIEDLHAKGEITHFGTRSVCWLGVPLIWNGRAMGVLAVQSYAPDHTYNERDQELLTFVSYHIANALQRKQTATSLKQANASLERRVTERTRALALANRDLREQIAERERVERRLKYETLHDSLTGLPNRTLFHDRLRGAIQRASRHQNRFALAYIDIDGFKAVNDQHGHATGDALLQEIARRLSSHLRANDTVARLGGDEFALVLEEIDSPQMALKLCEKLGASLAEPCALVVNNELVEVRVGASIGIAPFVPNKHVDADEGLMHAADDAMYKAKRTGKNRCVLAPD